MNVRYKLFIFVSVIFLGSCIEEPDYQPSQLQLEVEQIDDYLAAQGFDDVIYDNSTGIRFVIGGYGQGEVADDAQKVKFTYTSKLFSNGQIFDSGDIYDELNDVNTPPGMEECLKSIMAGTSATFYLPSSVAYGTTGASTLGVPANSIVIYEVTLTEVEKTAAQANQFEIDTLAIRDYLDANKLTHAIEHPSGIFYTIEQEGSGDTATPYDVVNFAYKLSTLSAPTTVIEQNTISTGVFALIDGLKIGFQVLKPNTKAKFYIPSGLAYGPTAQPSIPANANLIFEITLNAVN